MNQDAIAAIDFWALLLSAGILIVFSGDRPARKFLGAILAATMLTLVVDLSFAGAVAPLAYLAIDGVLLGVAGWYVLKIDAFWPIWFAGFQLITVASEVARLAFSGAIPEMYANVAGFWAIPALLTMAVGVMRDRRQDRLSR